MPCVCRNGRIIRCAEGNCVSHGVQKTILHPVLIGIVYEHVEGFAGGLHVHACQSHSIPRLIAESPFVDPPAIDGRQAIDDASTDCEFRVGGQFRETNRGYGKLSSWDRIAERADATLIAARGSHVRASDGAVRIDDEHSRRLPVRHAHHRIDLDRRAQFGGQHVFALHCIPTAITDIAGVSDEHHHAGADDREALRVVQGYGMLLKMDFHDSTCDSNFRTNEQIDCPIRCNRYLDRTLQV